MKTKIKKVYDTQKIVEQILKYRKLNENELVEILGLYVCPDCKKKFIRKSDLDEHLIAMADMQSKLAE